MMRQGVAVWLMFGPMLWLLPNPIFTTSFISAVLLDVSTAAQDFHNAFPDKASIEWLMFILVSHFCIHWLLTETFSVPFRLWMLFAHGTAFTWTCWRYFILVMLSFGIESVMVVHGETLAAAFGRSRLTKAFCTFALAIPFVLWCYLPGFLEPSCVMYSRWCPGVLVRQKECHLCTASRVALIAVASCLQVGACMAPLWLRWQDIVSNQLIHTREAQLFSATADDFTVPAPLCRGTVVLQADGLVKSKPGRQTETLVSLLCEVRPGLDVEMPLDELSYARVKVRFQDEASVRELIKSLGKCRGKHVKVREVQGTRLYDSPRD